MRLVRYAIALALGCVACGAPSAPSDQSADLRRIAEMHKSKCESCHKLVQPGTRTRGVLDVALARHRKRLKMTEDDWAKMTDYLASHGDASAPAEASRPAGPSAQ
jgi:hypothetical protein